MNSGSSNSSANLRLHYRGLSTTTTLSTPCNSSLLSLFKKQKEEIKRYVDLRIGICRMIENLLKEQVHFEADFYTKCRRIRELKTQIASKQEKIAKIRQRINSMTSSRGQRNLMLLEEKMNTHHAKISKIMLRNEDASNLASRHRQKILLLTAAKWKLGVGIFRMEKRQFNIKEVLQAWTTQSRRNEYVIRGHSSTHLNKLIEEIRAQSVFSPESRNFIAALAYSASFISFLSLLLDVRLQYSSLNYEIYQFSSRVSEDVLLMYIFKLRYSILTFCRLIGIPSEKLYLKDFLQNLHVLTLAFTDRLSKFEPQLSQKITTENSSTSMEPTKRCSGLDLDTKTRQQIFDEFQTIKWDENICDYDIDDVEGDWINVGFR